MAGPPQVGAARVAAVVTLVLAGAAAAVFGGLAVAPESLGALLWLLGWVLLTWAVLVGSVCAIQLGRGLLAGRPAAWPSWVLLGVGLAVVAVLVTAHPLWGSGSGVG
ncbi:hypothetical protein ASG41_08555 [Modestobacter sp. Leaf380]|nr:hypothetical protein ASG41_08555 [Modestobacter sp. Leaf380]